MSTTRIALRAAVVPLAAAALLVTAAPSGAMPTEGFPSPHGCVRIVPLPAAATAGSTLFVSHGLAAVLASPREC